MMGGRWECGEGGRGGRWCRQGGQYLHGGGETQHAGADDGGDIVECAVPPEKEHQGM